VLKQTVRALLSGAAIAFLIAALSAQTTKSVWDGVYTEAQAARGAAAFDKECAGCHGAEGAGGSMAPALLGPTFAANYDGQSVGDLFERNRATMPVGKEGGLSAQQVADITAYILQVNRFPAGATELPSQSMTLKVIKYLAQNPAEKH
jgi:mono/diheme cytochrome c family protein